MGALGSCKHLRGGGERHSIKLFLPLLWEYENVTEYLYRTILGLMSNSTLIGVGKCVS